MLALVPTHRQKDSSAGSGTWGAGGSMHTKGLLSRSWRFSSEVLPSAKVCPANSMAKCLHACPHTRACTRTHTRHGRGGKRDSATPGCEGPWTQPHKLLLHGRPARVGGSPHLRGARCRQHQGLLHFYLSHVPIRLLFPMHNNLPEKQLSQGLSAAMVGRWPARRNAPSHTHHRAIGWACKTPGQAVSPRLVVSWRTNTRTRIQGHTEQ